MAKHLSYWCCLHAAQEEVYSGIGGLKQWVQNPLKSDQTFVQILHVGGNHWSVVTNIGCSSDTVKVLDSHAAGEPSTQPKTKLPECSRHRATSSTLSTWMLQNNKMEKIAECMLLPMLLRHVDETTPQFVLEGYTDAEAFTSLPRR